MILSGEGRASIAGADIRMLQAVKGAAEAKDLTAIFHRTLNKLEDMRKPIIAAIHGFCLGGGLELQAKVMGPMGAIVAATKTNAEILRREKDLGTVEPGKLADLILVAGDPLEDISIFQKYQEKITLIMQGGCVYKNILA